MESLSTSCTPSYWDNKSFICEGELASYHILVVIIILQTQTKQYSNCDEKELNFTFIISKGETMKAES